MNDLQRFEAKYVIDPPTGCWLWIAGIAKSNGYTRFWNGVDTVAGHRWSYEYFKGMIPEDTTIDHLCRVRHCVNPAHLEAVSCKENIDRGWEAGRSSLKGESHNMVKLSEKEVLKIRSDHRTQREIAADYGVTRELIGQIKRREKWKHI